MPVKKKTAKPAAKKVTARKTASRKTVAKKAPAKRKPAVKRKAVAKKAAPKKTAKKAVTKAVVPTLPAVKAYKEPLKGLGLFKEIAELTDLPLKDIKRVFEALDHCIACSLKKRSCDQFTLPRIAKISIRVRPARRKGKGVNPFTGEAMIIKARPSARVVKVRALKRLKDMAEA